MSMYNAIFGQNPLSTVVLAMLNLTPDDCGRLRDVYVEEGKIAVYTRNGSGNRECWCQSEPKYGRKKCKHHVVVEEVDETYEATTEEIEAHSEWKLLNVFIGNKRMVKTGKRVNENFYVCENPCSVDCACPGCVIEYRLPKHPNYLSDRDDEFDGTYATIYFSFPEEWKDKLEKIQNTEPFDPDKQWSDLLERLKAK